MNSQEQYIYIYIYISIETRNMKQRAIHTRIGYPPDDGTPMDLFVVTCLIGRFLITGTNIVSRNMVGRRLTSYIPFLFIFRSIKRIQLIETV